MITKFIIKRNVNVALPFNKNFARVEVHSNGNQTFKFKKIRISAGIFDRILTETGSYLNTENSDRLNTN
jgi:hypothetical protein